MQPRYNSDLNEGKSKVHPPGRLATAQPSKQSNPASLKQGGRLSSKSSTWHSYVTEKKTLAPMVTLGFPGSDQADLPLLERKPLDQPHTSASSGFLFFFRVFRLDLARVAEVGKLSASAKNAFNSFVRRIFVNSRQKTLFFLIYYQNCNKKVVFT